MRVARVAIIVTLALTSCDADAPETTPAPAASSTRSPASTLTATFCQTIWDINRDSYYDSEKRTHARMVALYEGPGQTAPEEIREALAVLLSDSAEDLDQMIAGDTINDACVEHGYSMPTPSGPL